MKHSILLVDDEPNVLEGLQRALCVEPYRVLTANSGSQALKLLESATVDVVVADQDMPGMKGTDLLRQIRKRYPDTVRFMLTGNATLETAMSAINDGAISRFFTKPCNHADLAVSIQQGLQNKDLMTEAKRLMKEVRRLESIDTHPDGEDLPIEAPLSFEKRYMVDSYQFSPPLVLPVDIFSTVRGWHGLLKDRMFCPVGVREGKLLIAVANPDDVLMEEDADILFSGREIRFQASSQQDVRSAIEHLLAANVQSQSTKDVILQIEKRIADKTVSPTDEEAIEFQTHDDENAIIELVNAIIEDAYHERASDIHIEPVAGEDVEVRFRIDGVMRSNVSLPRCFCNAIISRIKIMAGLDIAERRKPQSGKIHFKIWGALDIELRVETYPIAGGTEHAVLRLLNAGEASSLSRLGMTGQNLSVLERIVQKPYGLFLCVGPTGCGKTTTLHSILAHINDGSKKILTIEDPVEITQPGLCQMQVNVRAGVTFAGALRSLLRADPDVIMVGEMRDLDTATVAVQAGLTGHLVFSTLHTNNAPETVTRLLDMGVDPYTFSDVLTGVLAQRLVRVLCQECRVQTPDDEALFEELRVEYGDSNRFEALVQEVKPTIYGPSEEGCEKCGGTGYKGRTAIHELSTVDDTFRALVTSKADVEEIRKHSVTSGMRTLNKDGIEKVLTGLTSIQELRRVCSR